MLTDAIYFKAISMCKFLRSATCFSLSLWVDKLKQPEGNRPMALNKNAANNSTQLKNKDKVTNENKLAIDITMATTFVYNKYLLQLYQNTIHNTATIHLQQTCYILLRYKSTGEVQMRPNFKKKVQQPRT